MIASPHAGSRYRYLRPEDILQLNSFEFAPKAVVEGYFAGRHTSHQTGSSLEFRDYRQYVPGDDPALIDWRVYARTDRPYLRTYEQETNMDGYLLLDSSASMAFGTPLSKLDYASFFTAALAYLILKCNDRVSLEIFDARIRTFFPPGSTTTHLHQILSVLETNKAGNKTSLSHALYKSFPLFKNRGTLVIVSDFFDDPAAIFEALSPYLHKGFKVHLFHILTPDELNLPTKGLVAFEDMESKQRVVAHSEQIATGYHNAMLDHMAAIRKLAGRRQVDYALARTDHSFYHLFDRLNR